MADDLTHYLVYEVTDNGLEQGAGGAASLHELQLVGAARAHDGRRAVTAVVQTEGEYVAIPARSLKTHTVELETQLRITVS